MAAILKTSFLNNVDFLAQLGLEVITLPKWQWVVLSKQAATHFLTKGVYQEFDTPSLLTDDVSKFAEMSEEQFEGAFVQAAPNLIFSAVQISTHTKMYVTAGALRNWIDQVGYPYDDQLISTQIKSQALAAEQEKALAAIEENGFYLSGFSRLLREFPEIKETQQYFFDPDLNLVVKVYVYHTKSVVFENTILNERAWYENPNPALLEAGFSYHLCKRDGNLWLRKMKPIHLYVM